MDSAVHGILQASIQEWVTSLLLGIFPAQGLNPGLPHCRQILYQLSHQGSPRILEWTVCPFCSGSSWPRNQTRVSCMAGWLFTNQATREALLITTHWQLTLNSAIVSCSVMSNSYLPHELSPTKLLCLWNSPGKETGVPISFSRGSSQPRDRTQLSYITSRFFTV